MGDLYALDFDGILCDSCGESSQSALKAAKERWPDIFVDVDAETEAWLLDSMQTVRPVVETGYENLLLVRLLLEMRRPHEQNSPVSKGMTVEEILKSWETIKPKVQASWGETNKDELVVLFGRVRDDWIKQDPLDWVKANRFYPGTADAIKFSTSTVSIVTTKQARFASLLLKEIAGVEVPADHIYGLGSGPKVEVLKKLQALPNHEGMTLNFVEDRLATLRNVIKDPELDQWHLYLGSWGYNTEDERQAAAAVSRINVIDLPTFCSKLK
ncbi:unnamed protein product [Calypogeia fissa]